jgi:hypothetical protein
MCPRRLRRTRSNRPSAKVLEPRKRKDPSLLAEDPPDAGPAGVGAILLIEAIAIRLCVVLAYRLL